MVDDTLLAFVFPAVDRKKVTAAFDGGRMASDGELTHYPNLAGAVEQNASAFSVAESRPSKDMEK